MGKPEEKTQAQMGVQCQNGSTRNWLGFMDWMDLDQQADMWLECCECGNEPSRAMIAYE